MKFLHFALIIAFLAVPAHAEDIAVQTSATNWTEATRVSFRTTDAAQSISEPIRSCPGMKVIFDRGSSATVDLYATNSNEDTYAEIAALTALTTFAADTSVPFSVSTGKPSVRFVVTGAETGADSVATVWCSNSFGAGGFVASTALPAGSSLWGTLVWGTDDWG